jgi:neutral trehalase
VATATRVYYAPERRRFPDRRSFELLRKLTTIAVSAALLAALTLPGAAAAADQLESSWATVNACGGGQLGARAQLAGDGSANEMSVRFTVQWLSPNGWVPLAGAATSPWQSAGSAEYTWGQAGWTYSISAPAGKSYQLRVVAEMSWGNRTATHVTGPCNITG